MKPMGKAGIEPKGDIPELKIEPINEVKSDSLKPKMEADLEDNGFIVLEHWDKCC